MDTFPMNRTQIARKLRDALRADPRCAHLQIPESPRLLGSSYKIALGEEFGILTTVLYLAPANEAGFGNMCPWATAECAAVCLGHSSGQMIFDASRNSRAWKTAAYMFHRTLFMALLEREIASHQTRAARKGLRPAVRLDGTSDLGLAPYFALRFPRVQFYDYTKSPTRAYKTAQGQHPENWHVTFSFSGHNLEEALNVLGYGGNVAVVFDTKSPDEFPETWHGFPVINADTHDARFTDPPGTVAGLTRKGSHKSAGPFYQPARKKVTA